MWYKKFEVSENFIIIIYKFNNNFAGIIEENGSRLNKTELIFINKNYKKYSYKQLKNIYLTKLGKLYNLKGINYLKK